MVSRREPTVPKDQRLAVIRKATSRVKTPRPTEEVFQGVFQNGDILSFTIDYPTGPVFYEIDVSESEPVIRTMRDA